MRNKIICRDGVCVDTNNLSCDEKYDNMIEAIECELLEENVNLNKYPN